MIIFCAGRYQDEEEPAIPLSSGGFLHGHGVFTTLLLRRGRPCHLEKHLERLESHARQVDLPAPYPTAAAFQVISELTEHNQLSEKDYRLRLTLFSDGPQTQLAAQPGPLPQELETWLDQGVSALTLGPQFQRGFRPQLKSTNYLPSLLALREAAGQGCQEALVCDDRDHLLEGAISNVFLVHQGELVTPPADGRILDGLTRRLILTAAPQLGIPCRERALPRNEARAAPEIFLTNAVRGVVPVTILDGQPVGNGRPGNWTRQLQAAWRDAN